MNRISINTFQVNLLIFLSLFIASFHATCQIDSVKHTKDSIAILTSPENHFINYTDSTTQLNLDMIAIKGGDFRMGSVAEIEEQPIHKVVLSDFYIGKYEITQEQWQKIMGRNPSRFKNSTFPVEQVSWNEVQTFIAKLNMVTNKEYRLPTEAEWEYITKAGTTTAFNTGNCLSTSQANYNGKSPYKNCEAGIYRHKELPVGSFDPNAWGIFDTHGNVWEWCNDRYSEDYYSISPENNPQGPEAGSYRVIRGGGWGYFGEGCRSANRGFYGASLSYDDIGFRLAHSRKK